MLINCTNEIDSVDKDVFKGSLVVIVPSEEGLVICADKRGYSGNKGVEDNQTKLFKIDTETAFSVTGNIAIYNKSGTKFLFNSIDIVKRYTSSRRFEDTNSYWKGLAQALEKDFANYLKNTKFEERLKDFPEKNYELFQVVFFNINKSKEFKIPLITYTYKKGNPIDRSSITNVNMDYVSFDKPFVVTGSTETVKELLSGNKEEFNSLREYNLLKPFLTNTIKKGQAKIRNAADFAKKIIEISSKNTPLYISPDCDCAILDYKTGYREIE